MSDTTNHPLAKHFGTLTDWRRAYLVDHDLLDMVAIALCAVICGADDWVQVASFGHAREAWLRQFLPLRNGIPSHDTFGRVFARLDASQFEHCFLTWVQAVFAPPSAQVIAIDGKTLRGSHTHGPGQHCLQLVSAWATSNRLVLAQRKVGAGNEITTIPQLLDCLALDESIVTIDAIGCQKEIARQIRARGADYVLACKANQGQLYHEIAHLFLHATKAQDVPRDAAHYCVKIGKAHGRIEKRVCWVIDDPRYLLPLPDRAKWVDLRTLICIEHTRRIGTTVSKQRRYYISSLPAQAARLLQIVRSHWQIENQVHWVLDVAFREDLARQRADRSAHNLALLRRLALNLLSQEQTLKVGIAGKRLRAGWDPDYLLKLLALLW